MTSVGEDRQASFSPGLAYKQPCRCASTAALVYPFNGLQIVDGVQTVANDRVLVKNQADQTQNGVWLAGTGIWVRDADFDGVRDVIQGTLVMVLAGTQASSFWQQTTANPVNPGTTAMVFAQVLGAGVAAPVIVGEIAFGLAGNTLGQDPNLFWDNTNKRWGVGTSAPLAQAVITGNAVIGANVATSGAPLDVVRAGTYNQESAGPNIAMYSGAAGSKLLLGVDNANNIGFIQSMQTGTSFTTRPLTLQAAGGRVLVGTITDDATNLLQVAGTGKFSTSVVTPAVVGGASTNLQFGGGATGDWVGDFSTKAFRPLVANDAAIDFGASNARVRTGFITTVDSGPGTSLSLRAGGATQVFILTSTGADFIQLVGGASGGNAVQISNNGSDANIDMQYVTQGSGKHDFKTNSASPVSQCQFLHTALSSRVATITGAVAPNQPQMSSSSGGGMGIQGTNTSDNAASGNYGEIVTSTVNAGSAVSLGTGVTSNITSITLGAGDWDITGVVAFQFGATTSYTNLAGGPSNVSATLGGFPLQFDYETPAAVPTNGADQQWVAPTTRFSLVGSATVFLVAQGTFTVSTLKAYGTIRARRIR